MPSLTSRYLGRIDQLNPALKILSVLGTACLSALVVFGCLLPVLRFLWECKPGEIDGQCGLGTLAAFASAFFGALVAWVGTVLRISVLLVRHRRSGDVHQTVQKLLP